MAEIDGGSLSFKSVLDNDQLNTAIDETMRRIQGLSDGTVTGSQKMDSAFDQTAESIRAALGQIGTACEQHEAEIGKLQGKYKELGQQAGAAFMEGRDDEGRAIQDQQRAIKGEIKVREELLKELRGQSDELENNAVKLEENRQKAETAGNAHVTFRTRLREVREALAEMEQEGLRGTDAYNQLQAEAGRLTDAMGDAQQQARILAHDNAGLQGVISAVNGLAGAMSIGTGVMQLFGNENEDLQRAMVKVQSVMAISMGMQQVMDTLNKDSAASLGLVGGLKRWWAGVVAKATVAETAETVATTANTAAQTANATATGAATTSKVADTVATGTQATAATAGTVANIGLAGAFRLVGAAIKSIPVFGWVIAGISALIGLYAAFSSKARAAKKEQEEFSKALIEGCYKPIGMIEQLSTEYTALGNNIKAKEKFIIENKKRFDELGVSVNNLYQAENILIGNKDRFIHAQIAKAKALIYSEKAKDKLREYMELQEELNNTPETTYMSGAKNLERSIIKNQMKVVHGDMMTFFNNAAIELKNEQFNLNKGNINAINKFADGEVGAIRQAISRKQQAMEHMKPNTKEYKKAWAEIESLQKKIANPTGGSSPKSTTSKPTAKQEDVFTKNLEERKQKYDEYVKWCNSGLEKEARTEFATLLTQGNTYREYLDKRRAELESNNNKTVEQQRQLHVILNEIANESSISQINLFKSSLTEQLDAIHTATQQLEEIKKMREEIQPGDPLKDKKTEALDNAEKTATEKQEEETNNLLQNYSSYLDKKINLELQFNNDMVLLEKARTKAKTDAEKDQIERTINERKNAFAKDTSDMAFEQLKISPDYVRAFDDLKNTSSETLEFLLAEFDKVKESAAGTLNPQDLQTYINAMQSITSELQSRDPFKAIKKGYEELKTAGKRLNDAKRELNEIRANGGIGTDAEKAAIKEVNKANDDYIKKKHQVRQAEKDVTSSVKELCQQLSSVGDTIGGQAGAVISLIGDIGSFTMGAIDAWQTASEASAGAIQTIEKASVILSIISTAMQVVTKIANIFAGDDGSAAYEKAESAYKNYISILDDVIDKQKELIASMTGEDAINSFKYANSLIENEMEAARELGKQYLNAGASSGVFGIGSKASHGTEQRKSISQSGWNQFYDVAQKAGISSSAVDGRMTGLFDLSVEQLTKLRQDAPVFWAQLHDDTREYLEQIIAVTEKTEDMKDTLNESLTGISFDSLKDTFIDDLSDMETSADEKSKKIGQSIEENIRKALINNMFKAQFQQQLESWYQMWSDAMNAEGDGGSDITDAEQAALDNLRNSIVTGATAAADKINEQFQIDEADTDDTLTGQIKGVSEDTAQMIGGQMNAIRINQLEATAMLRSQLAALSTIANNTSYNHHLAKLDRITALLEGTQSNSLRSQGLVNN